MPAANTLICLLNGLGFIGGGLKQRLGVLDPQVRAWLRPWIPSVSYFYGNFIQRTHCVCCVGAGYGHVAPKTKWGRLITIVYALVGIPLTFLYLSNMGNFMAKCFRLFYQRVSMTPISHRSCCDCDFITDTWPRPAESVCASGWCPTVRLSVRLSVPSYFHGVN